MAEDYIIIQKGDTLSSIAQAKGTTVEQSKDHSLITGLDGTKGEQWQGEITEFGNTTPQKNDKPTTQIYTVKPNEVASKIAREHGITLKELQAANPHIKNINVLKIGEKLNIPVKSATATEAPEKTEPQQPQKTPDAQETQNSKYYTVQPGDGLSKISKKLGVSEKLLRKVNFLEKSDNIKVGQKLYIPENLSTEQIKEKIKAKAKELDISESLALALADHESGGFNPYATSKTGAAGLFQLTQIAASQVGGERTYDIDKNIQYGLQYFKYCLDRCNDNVTEALVSYNKGYSVMKKAKAEGKDVDSFEYKGNPAWYAKTILEIEKNKYKTEK